MSPEKATPRENHLARVPNTRVATWFNRIVSDMRGGYDFHQNLRQIVGAPGSGKTTALSQIRDMCEQLHIDYSFKSFDPADNQIDMKPEVIISQIASPSLGVGNAASQLRLLTEFAVEGEPGPKTQVTAVSTDQKMKALEKPTDALVTMILDKPKNEPRVLLFDRIDLLGDEERQWLEGNIIGPLTATGQVIIVATANDSFPWAATKIPVGDSRNTTSREQHQNLIGNRTGVIELDNFTPDDVAKSLSEISPIPDMKTMKFLYDMTLGQPSMVNMVVDFFKQNGDNLTVENLLKHARDVVRRLKDEYVDTDYLGGDPYLANVVYLLAGAYRFTGDSILPLIQNIKGMEDYDEQRVSTIYAKLHATKPMVVESQDGSGVYIDPSVARILRIHQAMFYPTMVYDSMFNNFHVLNGIQIEHELGLEGRPPTVFHSEYLNVHKHILNTLMQATVYNSFSEMTKGQKVSLPKVLTEYLSRYLGEKNSFTIAVFDKLIKSLSGEDVAESLGEPVVEELLKIVSTHVESVLKQKKKKR